MSIATMARLYEERRVQEQPVAAALRDVGAGAPTATAAKHHVTAALEKLLAFVPTEVVALWSAAIGLLVPESAAAYWVIFWLAMAFLIVTVLLEVAIREKGSAVATPAARKALLVVVAAVAFTMWAFASPGSPAAAQWGGDMTRYFGVAAIAVVALLPRVTQAIGLAPIER